MTILDYSIAAGVAAGMITALVQRWLLPDIAEYSAFALVAGISLIFTIAFTFLTRETAFSIIENFYKITRPFGFWGPVSDKINQTEITKIRRENRRDILAVILAVPWQLTLFACLMMIVLKRWDIFGVLLILLIILSVGLYFSWYRFLGDEQPAGYSNG